MTDKNGKQEENNEREIIIDRMPARVCSTAQNQENVLYPLQSMIINWGEPERALSRKNRSVAKTCPGVIFWTVITSPR